ncbi:unnamed protein product [Polarella glacialis]|uniref:Uncharacterized protein n=1 Tax=Polarella glacialis TaxID=89957 RepID=A0A813JTA1_POLGL|nr:unnamed protein product [Polarella glacialis]CAE8684571.1 unnamed protein product [Polarella glacialis]
MSAGETDFWDRVHNTGGYAGAEGGERAIFTDEDPSTTIKGCGFRNVATALQSLLLIEQPLVRYKQYWTVRAMIERAQRHPHPTDGMQGALRVFREWMGTRRQVPSSSESRTHHQHLQEEKSGQEHQQEARDTAGIVVPRASHADEHVQRAKLAGSRANRHNLREHCKGDEKLLNQVARRDRAEACGILMNAAERRLNGAAGEDKWFAFPGPAFLVLFGGPGAHGYGVHACGARWGAEVPTPGLLGRCCCCMGDGAQHFVHVRAENKASWLPELAAQVGCPTNDAHLLPVVSKFLVGSPNLLSEQEDPGGLPSLQLGKRFPFRSFTLAWRSVGSNGNFIEEARIVCFQDTGQPRQLSVLSFFGVSKKRPSSPVRQNHPPKKPRQEQQFSDEVIVLDSD